MSARPSRLGEDHLFEGGVHLAPGGSLFEGGARAGAVARVGYGDLHGVLVHGTSRPSTSAQITVSWMKFLGTRRRS